MTIEIEFEGNEPKVGDKVYVVVGKENEPTGFWEARLAEIPWGEKTHKGAILTDPRLGDFWLDEKEPWGSYRILDAHKAVEWLRNARAADQVEIGGLKKRMDIERSTYHAALRAIATSVGFAEFKTVLEDFLKRLTR